MNHHHHQYEEAMEKFPRAQVVISMRRTRVAMALWNRFGEGEAFQSRSRQAAGWIEQCTILDSQDSA